MKQTTSFSRFVRVWLCLVLTAVSVLTVTSCTIQPRSASSTPVAESQTTAEPIQKGEGSTSFFLQVVDKSGNKTDYRISTDQPTVGAALTELHLIEGSQSPTGLYIKSVTGIVADYETDQTYWAFYANGEYAMTGVDQTTITADTVYMLKVES